MLRPIHFAWVAFICAWVLLWVSLMEGTRRRIARLSAATLDRWAADERYKVVVQETHFNSWLTNNNPFWLSHWGQPVYRVTILDRSGTARDAWVRCGFSACGRWWERVEIKWIPGTTRIGAKKAPLWDQELDA